MSALIAPDSYDDVIFRYGLTALYNGGDLQIENGDLALTKDGDLRLGAIPYNAMFRLVQSMALQRSGHAPYVRYDIRVAERKTGA